MRRLAIALCVTVVVIAAGCSLTRSGTGEQSSRDGGMDAASVGRADASRPDGGSRDGGLRDAGGRDAARPDGGQNPDAGRMDSGRPDAGPPDAGPPDAGPPDAGPPDAGPPDAGPATCATIYGSGPNYMFCSETATECRYYVNLATWSLRCDRFCESFGGTCLYTMRENGTCTPRDGSRRACDEMHADEICVCAR